MNKLSEFTILSEIYRSSSGAVYKARHKESGELVALKERRWAEMGINRDLLHEVHLLSKIKHPNVVKCLSHFVDKGSRLLVRFINA
jgi:serine/threonine protein kinase